MSITLFNKKYQKLIDKEIALNKYYDPHSKSKHHRHLDDIKKDIEEDLNNYGKIILNFLLKIFALNKLLKCF